MEVILNELQNGGVDIDMRTLSYHIQQCLEHYSTMYEQTAILPVNLLEIFEEMGVNNFGRAVAFLTYVYVLDIPENAMHDAVRLVATVLKDMDLTVFKVEESSLQRMFFAIKRIVTF